MANDPTGGSGVVVQGPITMGKQTARDESNFAESIIAAARRPTLVHDAGGGVRVFAVPTPYQLHVRDDIAEHPERARGGAELDTVESFIAYVTELKQIATRVYCKADFGAGKASFVAVLNDHKGAGGEGDYRDFRATYAPRATVQWQEWQSLNAKPMDQEAFATFIENHLGDIAGGDGMPTGGQMYQLARQIEVTKNVAFRSAIRPQSGGVQLEYVDREDEATTKRLELFERFALGISPFEGGPAYRVGARLRYRLAGGGVTFWYELIRPDLVIADAVRAEVELIRKETDVMVLMGRPT